MKRNLVLFILISSLGLSQSLYGQGPAQPGKTGPLPIVFVHGNGDDATRWVPTMWLFESNGYPADRLFAIRFHNPVARTDDSREEAARSSSSQAMEELSKFVQAVLDKTGAPKVVLVGSSRGGLTIRNYLQNGGGRRYVDADILCGTPNHGVNASETNRGGEFNGRGAFLSALNRPNADGNEVVAGVRTLTLRSDTLDKYAQPTGITSGHPDVATGVSFEGPALKGADNVVLKGEDHRELAFSEEAFATMYRFIAGKSPQTRLIVTKRNPVLSGTLTGFAGLVPTNDPLTSVHLRMMALQSGKADRLVYETTTKQDGAWGPVRVDSGLAYSFDLELGGRHVTYFLPPLVRSTSLLNFRFTPLPANAPNADARQAAFLVSRPAGYFSRDRDPVRIDDSIASQEPEGLPIRDSFFEMSTSPANEMAVQLRSEKILVHPSHHLELVLPIVTFLR